MQLEILALKHQLAVYQHSVKRPSLQPTDRLFWAWLSRLWSGWQQVLEVVQPRTVIAWQKKRFRDYCRRLVVYVRHAGNCRRLLTSRLSGCYSVGFRSPIRF
jgi:hypothetical protein